MSEIKTKQQKKIIVAEPILQSTEIQIYFWDLESNLIGIFLCYYLKYFTIFLFFPYVN